MSNIISINLLLMVYGLLVAHSLIMFQRKQFNILLCWIIIVLNSWLFLKYLS
jgi:hypothetical protein